MRRHLIPATVMAHTLRYGFLNSFQHSLAKALSLQMHLGQRHSWEQTTALQAQNKVLLSHPAVLKYFTHSSPHQDSSLQDNPGHVTQNHPDHATEVGLAICSANPNCPGEEASLLVWDPCKQTLRTIQSSQQQRKKLNRVIRAATRTGKQKLRGYLLANNRNLFV